MMAEQTGNANSTREAGNVYGNVVEKYEDIGSMWISYNVTG
jgi:hypothetical protein